MKGIPFYQQIKMATQTIWQVCIGRLLLVYRCRWKINDIRWKLLDKPFIELTNLNQALAEKRRPIRVFGLLGLDIGISLRVHNHLFTVCWMQP